MLSKYVTIGWHVAQYLQAPVPGGVQAIFLDGIWSNTPEDWEQPFTRKGHRLGVYMQPGVAPTRLVVANLVIVTEILEREAPQFIDTVKERIATLVAYNLFIAGAVDKNGKTFSAGMVSKSLDLIENYRFEATGAFGLEWVQENLYPYLTGRPENDPRRESN